MSRNKHLTKSLAERADNPQGAIPKGTPVAVLRITKGNNIRVTVSELRAACEECADHPLAEGYKTSVIGQPEHNTVVVDRTDLQSMLKGVSVITETQMDYNHTTRQQERTTTKKLETSEEEVPKKKPFKKKPTS